MTCRLTAMSLLLSLASLNVGCAKFGATSAAPSTVPAWVDNEYDGKQRGVDYCANAEAAVINMPESAKNDAFRIAQQSVAAQMRTQINNVYAAAVNRVEGLGQDQDIRKVDDVSRNVTDQLLTGIIRDGTFPMGADGERNRVSPVKYYVRACVTVDAQAGVQMVLKEMGLSAAVLREANEVRDASVDYVKELEELFGSSTLD